MKKNNEYEVDEESMLYLRNNRDEWCVHAYERDERLRLGKVTISQPGK